ncbi:MAG: VWA domain-containing protein [Pseudomonadota bacterium]
MPLRMHKNVRSFRDSTSGNIAMMFSMLMVPVLAAVGLGIDMSKSTSVQRALAEAADAGALAAARARLNNKSLSLADAEQIARKAFDINIRRLGDVAVSNFKLAYDEENTTYTINLDTAVSTQFVKLVGIKEFQTSVMSEVRASAPRGLELVMALDNTGSMSGSKMATLKTAAKDLATDLLEDAGTAKIGIVPFSNYVNVGTSRRAASWLTVPADQTNSNDSCWNTYPDRVESNCRTITQTCSSTNDGVTRTYSCSRRQCDVDQGDPVQVCGTNTSTVTWHGCVGSRDNVLDESDGDYSIVQIPGLMNKRCATELLPLTSTLSTVTSKIDAMSAQYATYIPSGLAWGRRLLSSQAPFTEGVTYAKASAERSLKALILMTDGENTRSANYPYHEGTNKAAANTKTTALCTSIKNDGIIVFTVAFEVTDTTTKSILQGCASSPENYFDASNPSSLKEAFDEIGLSLRDLALTR